MDKETYRNLLEVLAYLADDERENWLEQGKPFNHISSVKRMKRLRVLKKELKAAKRKKRK